MKYFATLASMATMVSAVAAAGVTGSPEGFASGTTGGGSATPVYPESTDELVSYLEDDTARVIVLNKEFNFIGTEGTATDSGCQPWGTGTGCQQAINKDDWCTNYQPDAPTVSSITYDAAAGNPILVKSNKSLVGEGSKGVIRGKGVRLANGVENVIMQNIMITDLNADYVWGGDAITLAGTDNIWIDHVTTSKIGRQHIVLGEIASGRVTISNSYIDGSGDWSATCDGHQYWALYFTGSQDQITFKNNYIYKTSGRAPKVQGNTILHAVNNYWNDNSGHAFEIGSGAYVLAEGNVFNNVKLIVEDGAQGQYNTADDGSVCQSALGRDCVANSLGGSVFSGTDTNFLSDFEGAEIATAGPASDIAAYVNSNAGIGKL